MAAQPRPRGRCLIGGPTVGCAAEDGFVPNPLPHVCRSGVPTGLSDLDATTHGLLPATLWVLAASPGTGRSMLAAQLARTAASTGATTRFISGREDRALIQSYWFAAEGRVPLHHLLAGNLSPEDATRLDGAHQRLQEAPLAAWTEEDGEWVDEECHSTASFRHQVGRPRRRARVIVADDVDILLDANLPEIARQLRDWTRSANFTLLVTVPEDQVLEGGRLLPNVAREADVVLHLARQGMFCGDSEKVGEAHLDVLRNRYGPVARIDLDFQGFYGTFRGR